MTSKEALENLVHCKSETKCKECKHKNRCTMERDYNTIKQDLERLEQLEQENQELKNDSFNLGIMISENKKLLKAIEIIKSKKVNIVVFFMCETLEEYNANYHEDYKLTKEQYELLCEVLGNE